MTESKRGGPGRGQGRKPLSTTEPTVTVCIRMPESYRDKLDRMAGEHDRSWWVREAVRRDKGPKGDEMIGQRERGGTVLCGYVLVTPAGETLAETFRPTSAATKGWTAMIQVDGRYERWEWFRRKGWRCKHAELTLVQAPKVGG